MVAAPGPVANPSAKSERVSGCDVARQCTTFAVAMLKEFDEVTLKRDVDVQGMHLSAGVRGVVVAVYADGAGYEVEFHRPAPVVLTLTADQVEAA
jgi:hypothetical protein